MADKYIANVAGVLTEVEATVVSAGAGDAGEVVALDGTGKIDNSVLPTGIGADTALIEASENLAAGDFVNIHDSTGPKVRKADASAVGTKAHGFVLAAVTSGQDATVYFEGTNDQVTGLSIGDQFLSETAGAATATAPTTSSAIVQRVGVAISTTAINVEIQQPIVLA